MYGTLNASMSSTWTVITCICEPVNFETVSIPSTTKHDLLPTVALVVPTHDVRDIHDVISACLRHIFYVLFHDSGNMIVTNVPLRAKAPSCMLQTLVCSIVCNEEMILHKMNVLSRKHKRLHEYNGLWTTVMRSMHRTSSGTRLIVASMLLSHFTLFVVIFMTNAGERKPLHFSK